ncbi:hypothetical protein BH11PLA2_BH11PLA2_05350 [soil metagenome]
MTVRALMTVLLLSVLATAQDETPVRPLKAGDPVPANFRAFVAADERFEKGSPRNRISKMHDLVTDNGLNPVVVVFSRQDTAPDKAATDQPVAKATSALASELSRLVTKYKPDRLGAFVNFITLDKEYQEQENRDPKAIATAALSAQLQTGNVPFTLAAKKSANTAAWGLDDKADITVVYYDRMVVKNVWTFAADKPPTAEDIKAIAAAVETDLKPKK